MFTGTRYLEVIDTAMVYYAKLSNQQVQQPHMEDCKHDFDYRTVQTFLRP